MINKLYSPNNPTNVCTKDLAESFIEIDKIKLEYQNHKQEV